MTAEKRTGIGDVQKVGVPVADQDRALEFYVDKLGFEKGLEFPLGGGQRWIEVAPPGATTTIAHADTRAVGVDADADEVLRWEGVPPMFAFRDRDGNGLEIVELR